MNEKKIYLLLTDTGTFFTRIIKLFTRKPYNHASIALNSDLSVVYSYGRKSVRNPFVGGFVKEDLNSSLFKQADCVVYSLTVTSDQIKNINSYIRQFEARKDHFSYNLLGLFGIVLNRPIKRKNAFFCSQFVASVLKECNIIHFEKDIALLKPSDLYTSSTFQFVYEGKLKEYHNEIKNESLRVPYSILPTA